jgi:hypothetical protein
MLDAVLEEAAFYQSADSANPDEELLHAVRPALLTIPDARVYGISSPYSRRGIVWQAYEKHWAQDSDVLIWNGSTETMNPGVDTAEIARSFEDDPAVALAEYGRDGLVQFRADVEALISKDVVEAVVIPGRRELPCISGTRYVAFVDPSGGSQDAMTLAIAHTGPAGVAVLDCIREVRPPFSPESVVAEFAQVLTSYAISRATSDRYGGQWPVERFAIHGIKVEPSERSKSEIYVEMLPLINAKRCELLDHPRLAAQLCGLERRTGRGTGRDSVDHGPGQHDDVANSVAGALVVVSGGQARGSRVIFSTGDRFSVSRFDSWAPAVALAPDRQPPEELDEHGI